MGRPTEAYKRYTAQEILDMPLPTGRRLRKRDGGAEGLSIVIHKNGLKTWTVRYRPGSGPNAGQETEVKLGDFPGLLPEEARKKAAKVRAGAQDGPGLVAQRRAEKAEADRQRRNTVTALCDDYLAYAEAESLKPRKPGQRGIRPSTVAKNRATIEKYVRPRLGALAVDKVTRSVVMEHARAIEKRRVVKGKAMGGPAAAASFIEIIKRLMNHAVDIEVIAFNPLIRVKTPTSNIRDRIATEGEIKALWAEIDRLRTQRHPKGWMTATAILLCILTMKRRSEVCGINDSELNLDAGLWTIPPERSKSGREDKVPLTPMTTALIREALKRSQRMEGNVRWAFAGKGGKSPLDPHVMTRLFTRIAEDVGAEGLTLHDMRRTGASTLPALGYSDQLISRILNHSVVGVARVTASTYVHYDYVAEKRAAYLDWEGWLRAKAEVANDAAPQPAAVAAE